MSGHPMMMSYKPSVIAVVDVTDPLPVRVVGPRDANPTGLTLVGSVKNVRVRDAERVGASSTSRALTASSPAYRPGVASGQKWTTQQEDVLRMHWGVHRVEEIASMLARSPSAIYGKAAKLGLGLGAPQGWEYITVAAARVGYACCALRRILRWAHVHVRQAVSHPSHRKGRSHIVEPADVDAAVARWCRLETAADAARRHGISIASMDRILRSAEARGVLQRSRGGTDYHWRVEPAVVDRLLADRAEREDGKTAARRLGIEWRTLRRWILEAGLRGTTRRWWVRIEDIDRIAAEKRARGTRAFCKPKTEEATSP